MTMSSDVYTLTLDKPELAYLQFVVSRDRVRIGKMTDEGLKDMTLQVRQRVRQKFLESVANAKKV
jgi:hypothetical protein